MKSLVVKIQGADGSKQTIIFDTDEYSRLREIMDECGLNDFKILDWKLEKVSVYTVTNNSKIL